MNFPLHFHQPLWIAVGLVVCILLVSGNLLFSRKRQKTLRKFASPKILAGLIQNVSLTRKKIKISLIILAVFCLFVALARPQYGFRWVDIKRKGIDILFAIDTSKSMLAQDIKPNRLERARYGILDFAEKLEGDRVGLMPFAGSAYLMSPLTLDYNGFETSLAAVNTNTIPKGGTNLAELIRLADETLTNNANHKILIVLTDGENLQGDALQAAQKAAENGMTIHTVGVGTPQGELIPTGTNNTFIKGDNGKYITSKLDEAMLERISSVTGGISVLLGNSGAGLEQIYHEKLKLIPKEELKERRKKVAIERFEYPLGLALLLLCFEFLIRESPVGTRKKNGVSSAFTVFLLCSLIGFNSNSYAGSGEEAYAEENYLKAGEIYQEQLSKNPFDHRLHYNSGTVAYKNNMIDEAIKSFNKSLESTDIELQEKSYYNLGNSHYQKGLESAQADPQKTVEQWEKSIQSFDANLALNPENKAAESNRNIVQKMLDELKKQLEEQQKDQQQSSDQNQDQNKSDKKDEGDENNSDQQNAPENKDSKDKSEEQQQNENNQKDQNQNKEGEKPSQEKDNNTEQQKPDKNSDKGEEDKSAQPQPQNEQKSGETDTGEGKPEGQMSLAEAQRLLDALRDSEGELNFVPGHSGEQVEKDW